MSAIAAEVDVDTVQRESSGKKLRVLEGMEECFWLLEKTFPATTMILAEVEGPSTIEAWKNALGKVQQRYPLLTARIRKNPGERPYFETSPDMQLPLHVVPLEDVDLDKFAAEEKARSFGYGDRVLARFTLCHGSQRCVILLAAHHAINDGLTNVQIVRDLIAAAAGETLGESFPVTPAIGEILELGAPGPYTELYQRKEPMDTWNELPALKMQRELFRAEEIKALREKASAEGSTVHGALLAAFFLAGKHGSERWRTAPVVCLSPVNLRPMLNLAETPGVLIGMHPSVMQPSDDLPFWDFARKLKEELHASQSKEVAALGVQVVRNLVKRESNPDELSTFFDPGEAIYHDLMVSNYGDPGVRTDFGSLQLKALYPSVASGRVETQTISAVTVNGAMCITLISRHPLPSLVKDACAILRDACAAFSPEAR